ncbi:MAG: UvrD-helicase domain-containing protein [Gemmatimonadales bacterium]|nr:UvrD-helicase domain-containing protein [Gemmatimonadales bacterium]
MTATTGIDSPLRSGAEPVPTPAQLRAIQAPLGPVLVVAGPGAGKTFCLIGRIAHLIRMMGLDPRRICAITFTNKAADEIASRLRREIGAEADEVTRGTLHALCLGLLREHAAVMGLRRGFGLADEDYQKRVLQRLRIRPERQAPLLRLFGRHQLEHFPLCAADLEHFASYREALRSRSLLDYNDLIALTGDLFRRRPQIAAGIRGRWDAVLVDEFQDLSLAQYEVITGLTAGHRHCFAVGDDEQSIYSWAGADPRILERFGTDFEVARPIVLERNRRCSRQIFDVARRVIALNPALFEKRLEADRESEHCVAAYAFADEVEEASWLLEDLWQDRAATELQWGEYALLYRAHVTGQYLETRCIEAGIPCRLAQGQSVRDDELIAFVLSSLRVVRSPDDLLAIEAFAEQVLPQPLIEQVRARYHDMELVSALRAFGRAAKGDADSRKAWRFVFHVENLAALGRTHDTLGTLVDELLSQRIGKYRNPLEERAGELSDPADYPGAAGLAERIAATAAPGGAIWVEPDRGIEIPTVRLLQGALGGDVRRLLPGDRPLPGDLVLPAGAFRPLALFKALQLHHCGGMEAPFQDYVAFDLETTDKDIADCEIVEVAAVRVRGGVVVAQFEEQVRPNRPISPAASKVHGYYDHDLCDEPLFDRIWPAFRAFVGGDILVAHNGQGFDMPVLRRLAAGLPGVDELVFYDTLPLARSLLDESAKLEDLAHRFGVDVGRSHHALDDASALAGVMRHLGALKLARARRSALVQLLGWLGLALALDDSAEPTAEERLLRDVSLPATVGRYGDCLQVYAEEREAAGAPPVEELAERLGGARLIERIRTQRPAEERYPTSVARLSALVQASAAPTLAESIDLLLGRIALSRSDGSETDEHRINLLTLHSTKGLEFSRVYVVGAEDSAMPGFHALNENREQEIQEARRLLYVGMTRAKDRLVLTRAERRGGRPTGGAMLLREAGLEAESPEQPASRR